MPFIAYYRVSTAQQGQSGLGLEAQKHAVLSFTKDEPPLAEYTEIESGRIADRPQLALALEHAKETGATLVVAKLDRLSRSVAFLSALMEAKTPFIACDFPQADEFTIHILAAVAQREARLVSQRTKAALAAAKARGVKLGNPNNLTDEARKAGSDKAAQLRRDKCKAHWARVQKALKVFRGNRTTRIPLQEQVEFLNSKRIKTFSGKPWTTKLLTNFRYVTTC